MPHRLRAAQVLVRAAERLLPAPPGSVCLHSLPDLDDNVVALLRERPDDVAVTVLADDPGGARARAASLGLTGLRIVPKRSPRGVLAHARADVVVSTHGVFGSGRRPRGKRSVGLWHGEFGKLIGTFAGEPTRHFDLMPVSSQLSRAARCAEFGLHPDHVLVTGSPRQRPLLEAAGRPSGAGAGPRSVVWVPTYRTTVTGQHRDDGDAALVRSALPLDDPALLAVLDEHDAVLHYRPHPMAAQDGVPDHPRLRRATNADLESRGTTFYDLLADSSCLVTDYSSVWVDYLLLDRPMVAFCPDLAHYRRARGLALEPHEEWFPGPVTTTREDALSALRSALASPAEHRERRSRTRALLHAGGADPAAAVWSFTRAVRR